MGSTRYRGLFLVLVLQPGPIYSLVPHVVPPRACRHGAFSPESPVIAQTSSQPHTRRCTSSTMSQQSPRRDGTGRVMPNWHPVRARAMIATILATAVVFTGVVPAWEVAPGSMEHSQRTARVASVGGVPSASAAGFNDEQRAIAETWRTVDRLYVDRTFAGQDWFALRQQALKDAAKGMTEAELNSALAKMLASLGDRYTRYLPPAKYATIVQSSSGDVAGVGVSLSFDSDRDLPLVVGIEKGTPAAEAGLQAGDLLLQISGDECRGLTPDDAAALLRGTENTKVGIVAERGGSAAAGGGGGATSLGKGEKLDLIVTRRKFKVEGVVSKEASIDGRNVGIIRIKSFSSNTVGDVQAAVDRFKSKGVNRLVVDLRGNVGGLLPAGIDTAGLFLDSGKDVVFIIRKNGSVEARTTAEAGPAAQGPPLTLLVDKGTASAAEVFAAAVRENARATLVGERTFGKGVIQTVEPLSSGGGVAVTVARYETPLHNNINKVGIPVDKAIDCPASRESAECDI